MTEVSTMPQNRMALVSLVFLSICLQLVSSSLVKYTTVLEEPQAAFVAIAILAVLGLNLGRLLIWNAIHKRYPVSMAYPLSALVFPGVLLVAWLMGETVGRMQVAGGLLVMTGVVMMLYPGRIQEAQFPPDD